MIVVTGCINPDLDGVACAVAYAEFLNKKGKRAVPAVFGKINRETEAVAKKWNLKIPVPVVVKGKKVSFVNSTELFGVDKDIDPKNVIEIIDHRKAHGAKDFPNAKVQIELVGATATLVAEKFYPKEISKESAALLYSAIVSNTINFMAKVTTKRDKKMAAWLHNLIKPPEDYVIEIFTEKSQFDDLKEQLHLDFKKIEKTGVIFGITQLEIVEVDLLIEENLSQIVDTLEEMQDFHGTDFTFLTCIDILESYNRFVAADPKTRHLLEEALGVEFEGFVTKRDGIIMRKEIVPLLLEAKDKI